MNSDLMADNGGDAEVQIHANRSEATSTFGPSAWINDYPCVCYEWVFAFKSFLPSMR